MLGSEWTDPKQLDKGGRDRVQNGKNYGNSPPMDWTHPCTNKAFGLGLYFRKNVIKLLISPKGPESISNKFFFF